MLVRLPHSDSCRWEEGLCEGFGVEGEGGGGGLACLCRERKAPCSVLYAVPLTRTLRAGGTKARVDNASRYLRLARVKRLRRERGMYTMYQQC